MSWSMLLPFLECGAGRRGRYASIIRQYLVLSDFWAPQLQKIKTLQRLMALLIVLLGEESGRVLIREGYGRCCIDYYEGGSSDLFVLFCRRVSDAHCAHTSRAPRVHFFLLFFKQWRHLDWFDSIEFLFFWKQKTKPTFHLLFISFFVSHHALIIDWHHSSDTLLHSYIKPNKTTVRWQNLLRK